MKTSIERRTPSKKKGRSKGVRCGRLVRRRNAISDAGVLMGSVARNAVTVGNGVTSSVTVFDPKKTQWSYTAT